MEVTSKGWDRVVIDFTIRNMAVKFPTVIVIIKGKRAMSVSKWRELTNDQTR